jgi:hypothetical protein
MMIMIKLESIYQRREVKKIVPKFLILLSFLSSFGAYSQQREIQDSLIYSDPTVSGTSYIYGGSFEYWSSKTSANGNSSTVTQPGFNLFAGKDNLTASFSYRGSGSSTITISGSDYSNKTATETEGSLRWLSKNKIAFDSVYPYITIGYLSGYSYNSYYRGVHYTGPTYGVGGIVPFNDKFGLRTEVKLLSLSQKPEWTSYPQVNSTGNTVTGNVYWNFDADWNAQFGAKKTYYGGGGVLSTGLQNTNLGYFVMIGKSYK